MGTQIETGAEHTSGPWKAELPIGTDPNDPAPEYHIYLAGGSPGLLAEINPLHELPKDVGEANAHLIAAAPDMLEALIDAKEALADAHAALTPPVGEPAPEHEHRAIADCECSVAGAYRHVRAAIAKAKGA